jgi:acyl-CoA reductase-like NAD-dependent aldehyde dehydrogenase
MYNTGQSCCSVERIYVHEQVHEAFVEAFVQAVGGFRMGDPMSEDTYIGPLTRMPQLDVLAAQVEDARERGATVLTGGRIGGGSGNWFEPTVVVNVDHTMEIMREESFGPVIGIQKVRDDAEAIRLMNDSVRVLPATVDTVQHRITLSSRGDARVKHVIAYATLADNGLRLWGVQDADTVDVTLRRLDHQKLFRLLR